MNRLPELRNLSVTVAAILAVIFLFFGLGDSHMRSGMIAQFAGGFLVLAVTAAAGSYSHRKIWPDIRPHLFKIQRQESIDGEKGSIYLSSSSDVCMYRLYASLHRYLWIATCMAVMAWFLSNSGVL